MEKEKYYTPEIPEFYIGFEYQRFGLKDGKEYWWDFKFGESPMILLNQKEECVLISSEDLGNCRVKYLDKEDIESLGWVSWSNHPKHFYHPAGIKKFSDGTIQHNITLRIEDNNIIAIRRYSESPINFNKFAEFYGICKNKSELKKLMQMLNIQQVK